MSNESTDDPTDYVLVVYEKGTQTPMGRSIMTFTSHEGAERAVEDDDVRARYKDYDLKIEEFTGDHTSVYRVGEYAPKCPPPEPPLGTVVKDRHGALSMRQKYGALEGWGDPWGGTMPYGRWADMWEARGPLEVVPHPRTVKEEKVTGTTPKTYEVRVPMPEHVREFFRMLTDIADIKQVFDDHLVIRITTEEDEYELGRSMMALESNLWSLGQWENTPKVSRPKTVQDGP